MSIKWKIRVGRSAVEYGFITIETDLSTERYKAQDQALDTALRNPSLIDWSGETRQTGVTVQEITQEV